MENFDFSNVGIVGILVMLVLKLVFEFIRDNSKKTTHNEMEDRVREIHTWLRQTDADGVPRWHNAPILRCQRDLNTKCVILEESIRRLEKVVTQCEKR